MTPRPYRGIVDYPEAVRRLKRGAGVCELAREYGVSACAISRGARRHGWPGGVAGRKPRIKVQPSSSTAILPVGVAPEGAVFPSRFLPDLAASSTVQDAALLGGRR